MLQKPPVTNGLMLLDVKPRSFSEQFARYRDDNGLMHIEGCRRDVLIGREDVLQNAPDLGGEDVTLYQNINAYTHLLTYVTGLISRTRGESQIVSQFKKAYAELQSRDSESAQQFHRLVANIICDNSVVRNHVTPLLKPAFYEACAHELSNQNDGDIVLVVANTHPKSGKPDAETEQMVRYIGGNKRQAAKTIVFTHPDGDQLRRIYSYFFSQKRKGRIKSSIEMLPFEQALDANTSLQRFNKTFVCFPMGKIAEVDAKIIKEWKQKEVLGGKLIHLGGSKKTERHSNGAWVKPELWSYVTPEEITEWQTVRKKNNENIIKAGFTACLKCAELRSQNKKPNQKMVL